MSEEEQEGGGGGSGRACGRQGTVMIFHIERQVYSCLYVLDYSEVEYL